MKSPESRPRAGEELGRGAGASVACFFVAACAAFACHAVMDETYDPLTGLRLLGIFIADVLVFSATLFVTGAACLVAFAATGKNRAALVALVPVCLGPLVVLGVYLLFRFGAAWS